jgi:hypothetical protein
VRLCMGGSTWKEYIYIFLKKNWRKKVTAEMIRAAVHGGKYMDDVLGDVVQVCVCVCVCARARARVRVCVCARVCVFVCDRHYMYVYVCVIDTICTYM